MSPAQGRDSDEPHHQDGPGRRVRRGGIPRAGAAARHRSATAVDPRLGFVVAAARSACRSCESKAQCQLALAMPRLALGDVAPFCPNAERISYLQCSGLKRKG
jgi:hypothetical protein